MKLTEWFDSEKSLPAMHGVYETRIDDRDPDEYYQFWNGRFWARPDESKLGALMKRNIESGLQKIQWRGLAKDPKNITP